MTSVIPTGAVEAPAKGLYSGGERVYVSFGNVGVFAYDVAGKLV